ncbi:MAG: hypothetical protein IIZ78_19005 [Clostridiales bacterium]|nr:hypothetical protein [Clostridiales bacterium]
MKLSNKTYDTIKFIALLIAPIATFVAALVDIWGIPYGSQIVATISALDVFVGALVVILKTIYEKAKEGK